jgi:hypothetical protein
VPTFPTLLTPQRNEAAGLAISALGGLLNVKLDGAPIRRPKSRGEAGTKLLCPDPSHEAPATVNERFVCADGHAHTRSEMLRGRELDDGTIVPIVDDGARVEAVTGGLPKGELSLNPHPADEVDAFTRPDGIALRLRLPRKHATADTDLYAALVALAADPRYRWVGPMVVGSTRRFWVLTVWHGQLLLEGRIETADLAPPDEVPAPAHPDVAEKLAARAAEFVAELAEPFDPDVYRHDAKAAIDQLAAATDANLDTATPVQVAPSVENLLGMLDDQLAKRRAKRDTAKKAPAKRGPKAAAKAG